MNTVANDARAAGARVGLSGDTITINGGHPLSGRIEVKGAKNLVTKAMVAALLGESPSELRDVPDISDVRVVKGLLEVHGVKVEHDVAAGVLKLDPAGVESAHMTDIDAHAGSSRIPILFCGPLLHRLGEAFIPDLGGCRIGDRPIDYHLEVLGNFGAVIEKLPSGIRMTAPDGLVGTKISLPYPSVGATEQVLLTAVRAKGKTELSGAAIEPEIMDLINILQKMGAIISVDTDRVIRIEGVDKLEGYTHRALFDRNEAASWASAALATGGDIFVGGAQQAEMLTFLNIFRKVGGAFEIHDDGIRFFHPGGELKPVVIETDVHPGFMTDWQQPLVIALTKAQGVSIVHETVYEQRFGFVDALIKMGANIQLHSECLGGHPCRFGQRNFLHSAVISGPTELHGADIEVPDLRGGFSHLIAALTAKGTSRVSNVGIISRGYGDFITKLRQLGADFVIEGE
ncbi:MAG: UDP-N-acetylglucosamine 1-carboxyvinyltransferase [Aurantimicrobium sp.]|uniref:UDP-N-acetylglucosamine 1-carboxyvinyltransferase n=2 Tax=Aurantimicrobium TaxID=1705353 RepID=A0A2Z3RWM7_9MICO|nr:MULTISPECIES: UDP-N-acetylglucosamine 1-carboxyvinyltransferase [Aurantimicrobium]AWR21189.1 UDP-N-acetylglucosamine 1-carboxyvinyltransferase 1 [Aurantimicrobium photophilum]MDH6208132.1 UDP-N-acetylglucosamine 1-carboxyvinyltransferase [Aurantimicrobium minutum]MDH6255277.1 UDP-N-acetylglucosamine 1-carboxyvinyltransferase [Aurantimicrobium minutum]MDH6409414.1 UDP-N-acetylglucosamine 1-carboxyvinyltransferase [Aurantimicrobium minutum]MDH6424956.1 UDP-N-acetylglucosamine 1-carboxyvinyltr